MSKIIVMTSGKGGVGKTTSAAAFAAGLAQRGYKTVVVDFDVGLRNLDLIMGCERRVVFDLINVIQGEARLKQALIDSMNLKPERHHFDLTQDEPEIVRFMNMTGG